MQAISSSRVQASQPEIDGELLSKREELHYKQRLAAAWLEQQYLGLHRARTIRSVAQRNKSVAQTIRRAASTKRVLLHCCYTTLVIAESEG